MWTVSEAADEPAGAEMPPNLFERMSTRAVVGAFLLASAVTLVAGVMLEQTGNELADDLGMNGGIFGATILAAVTSLPEISSGLQAVRLGSVELAMSDIYGGNAVQLTFFLLADILAQEPVLSSASAESLWLGALSAVVTGVFAYGVLVRLDGRASLRTWRSKTPHGAPDWRPSGRISRGCEAGSQRWRWGSLRESSSRSSLAARPGRMSCSAPATRCSGSR